MLLTGRYLVISRQLLLLLSANAWKTRHKKKIKKNEVKNKNKLFRRRWLFYKCTCVDYYWIATISPSYIKQQLIPHICISLTTQQQKLCFYSCIRIIMNMCNVKRKKNYQVKLLMKKVVAFIFVVYTFIQCTQVSRLKWHSFILWNSLKSFNLGKIFN